MFNKTYSNFVKATSPEPDIRKFKNKGTLSGEEARKLYLEEVKHAQLSTSSKIQHQLDNKKNIFRQQQQELPLSNRNLFTIVQTNDVETLQYVLDTYPDKINVVDDFGWSLLMIACQADSTDAVKLLLKRGIDMSVRDKAGNSARSLVIKNKNFILADILLRHIQKETPKHQKQVVIKVKSKEEFMCEICNKIFPDREEHLSSTLHNISASRGKKITANYVIPASNKGYQLMLKDGWDRQSGLGRDGSGTLYPIKTVQKRDRKGLGHSKQKHIEKSHDIAKHKNVAMLEHADKNRAKLVRDRQNDKTFEIKFRREFY